jgi:tRNA pseudouridine38-40 synthase
MQAAAPLLEGEHDFTSFVAVDPERGRAPQSYARVRTIFSSAWRRERHELIYEISGSGFLHHMVRNLVGTFLLVGRRKLAPSDVTRILLARDRSRSGATAPASGLFLVEVAY